MRIRHIVLLPVACPALPYFTRLSHTRNDFRGGGKLRIIKCVSIFSTIWLKHFSFWEEFIIIVSQMYTGLHAKDAFFFPNFNEILIFSTDFRKIKYQLSQKSVQWGGEGGQSCCCMRADWWTYTTTPTLDLTRFLRKRLKTHISFTVIDTCLDLNWWSTHTKGWRTAILQHMCIM